MRGKWRRHLMVCRTEVLAALKRLGKRSLVDEMSVELAALEAKWDSRVKRLTGPVTHATMSTALDRLRAQLGGEMTVDMEHPAIVHALADEAGRKIRLNRTLQKRITIDIAQGLGKSETVNELAERLRGRFRVLQGPRALAVARTEVGRASQVARFEAYEVEGITQHQWVSARDSEVRDSHTSVDGEIVEVGLAFSNGLRHPLDPAGTAEEVINCRCDAIPIV